jgi:hypothetical protein
LSARGRANSEFDRLGARILTAAFSEPVIRHVRHDWRKFFPLRLQVHLSESPAKKTRREMLRTLVLRILPFASLFGGHVDEVCSGSLGLALCRRDAGRQGSDRERSVNPPNVYGFGHQAYYQHVMDCLKSQRAALVDGLERRKSLELITALHESIETGEEVHLHFAPKLSRLGVVS